MNKKSDIERLVKDELIYEIRIRGGIETGSVADLRKELRCLLKVEKNASFVLPSYPYSYDEDVVAINLIISSLERDVETFVGTKGSSEYHKFEARLNHAQGRLERTVAETEEQRQAKSQLLMKLTRIAIVLEDSVRKTRRSSVKSSVPLDVTLISAVEGISVNESSSEGENEEESPVESQSAKPIPVVHWKLKFSGEAKGNTLCGFLERVDELRIARNVSKGQLFRSAVDLFEGQALVWYRANRYSFSTWEELVVGLKQTFLPRDYDEKLYQEIRKRTQGDGENIAVYVAIMDSLFTRLSAKIPERTKLHILMKNITPFYQSQLALTNVDSITHLVELCQRLEERKASIETFEPPPRRFDTFEAELAYASPARKISAINTRVRDDRVSVQGGNKSCWNCKAVGHMWRDCNNPRTRFCYRCGEPNQTVISCRKCRGSGNAKKTSH